VINLLEYVLHVKLDSLVNNAQQPVILNVQLAIKVQGHVLLALLIALEHLHARNVQLDALLELLVMLFLASAQVVSQCCLEILVI